MIVELSDDEIYVARTIGGMRTLIARSNNVKDAKIGKQSGMNADEMGFIAEFAWAKANNCFPDLGLSPRSGSADGKTGEHSYDVKATHREQGRLLTTLKENNDVDYYVLAIVREKSVRFAGYAWKHELVKPENIIDLGHGKGYGLTQDKLAKISL